MKHFGVYTTIGVIFVLSI